MHSVLVLYQWCTNPKRQVAMAIKVRTVAPNACGSFVSPIWRPEFWDGSQTDFGKVCAPVVLQIVLFTDLLNCPDCGSLQSTLSPHPSSGLTTIPSSMLHR